MPLAVTHPLFDHSEGFSIKIDKAKASNATTARCLLLFTPKTTPFIYFYRLFYRRSFRSLTLTYRFYELFV